MSFPDARYESIYGERYCQVIGKRGLFIEAYPIAKKGVENR